MDAVPGKVSMVLTDASVGLFRADERVFEAMVDGWRTQMLARGLTTQTIKGRCGVLQRFQRFAGTFPWQWRPVDLEDFLAERRSGDRPISLTTLRADSNAVAAFCTYLTQPVYGWAPFCERTFGDVPSQISFEWNTPRHTAEDAVSPGRRAFTKAELQRLFDYLDDHVDREYAAGSKRWLPALRDSIALLTDPGHDQTAAHPNSPWIFRGHSPGRHLSAAHLRQRLKTVFSTRAARLGTLGELAKLSPIPVLAETLGYSQATLERHATAEATTYGRYIATRR